MTPDQKAALNQLFAEAVEIGEHIEWFKNYHAPEENQRVQEKYQHLRTTFADRVAEILCPHPILEKIVNLYDDHRVHTMAFQLAMVRAREILKPKEGDG